MNNNVDPEVVDIQTGSDNAIGARVVEAPAQTLSGNMPIASGERVLQHGSDDQRIDDDSER